MANADGNSYLVKKTKISGSTYILHSNDYGVSRRIYIGLDDEHLKAIKAINLINDSSRFAIAWEPDPENFKLLKCNIILNDLEDKVTLYNLALGRDSGKTLKFELSEDNFGDHRIRVRDDSGKYHEESRKIIEVKSETLDSYIDTFRQENLSGNQLILWIDVQGYEGEVLAGARTLIDQMKPAIGMEFWPYGLGRANGIDPLIDAIRCYDTYLDLRQPKPRPQSISNLFDIYSKYKDNDECMLDVLLL